MDHGGRVVLGIHAVKRVTHHGFAQKPLGIALGNAAVDCRFKITACDVYILPDLEKQHRHPCILTDRHIELTRGVQIFTKRVHDFFRQGFTFLFSRFGYACTQVAGQDFIRLDQKPCDGIFNFGSMDFAHGYPLSKPCGQAISPARA